LGDSNARSALLDLWTSRYLRQTPARKFVSERTQVADIMARQCLGTLIQGDEPNPRMPPRILAIFFIARSTRLATTDLSETTITQLWDHRHVNISPWGYWLPGSRETGLECMDVKLDGALSHAETMVPCDPSGRLISSRLT